MGPTCNKCRGASIVTSQIRYQTVVDMCMLSYPTSSMEMEIIIQAVKQNVNREETNMENSRNTHNSHLDPSFPILAHLEVSVFHCTLCVSYSYSKAKTSTCHPHPIPPSLKCVAI